MKSLIKVYFLQGKKKLDNKVWNKFIRFNCNSQYYIGKKYRKRKNPRPPKWKFFCQPYRLLEIKVGTQTYCILTLMNS